MAQGRCPRKTTDSIFIRGIDMAAPLNTPVFAMTGGVVRIAGQHSAYADPLVAIRHYRPGSWGDCRPNGCYHSFYLHLSSWAVSRGEVVKKGQLIGYTGESSNGFKHLHFEIRNARPDDPFSSWQRDAVHPLRILPYVSQPTHTQVIITQVNVTNPMNPRVELSVVQPSSIRTLDVNRIEVEVYDKSNGSLVPQAGEAADENGYHVHPPYLDFEQRNVEYTHKNSSSRPWETFADCPFANRHALAYSAHIHVCQADPHDPGIGQFNGIRIHPSAFASVSADYELTVEFTELVGVANANDLCVVAYVKNARGGLWRACYLEL